MTPRGHDTYDIQIQLVTSAGNEYVTQANLTHYEDLTQLEDDIVSFLPTVSDIEVFGCEVDLFEPDTQLPLSENFHTTLLQQSKLQILVRPCMEEGHSLPQGCLSPHQSTQRDSRQSVLRSADASTCSYCERDQARWLRCLARLPTAADRQTPVLSHQP